MGSEMCIRDRPWVDYISTLNVIVEWLLCAYSRDNIVWQPYAHDLGQAAHGKAREAGRPCVFPRTVIRTCISVWATYVTALLLLSYAITRYTHGGWERVAGRVCSNSTTTLRSA